MTHLEVDDVVVSRRGAERVRRGHPWIFKSDVERGDAAPGAVVRVVGPRGRVLGYAFHSTASEIRLRVFERG
jgi:23S rRNA (cytosine1962-C5)-methyltransferase